MSGRTAVVRFKQNGVKKMTLWVVYLVLALFALVRGSGMFVTGAKQVGASLGMSKFSIGVLIVGFGTSLPEFASSVAAALSGSTEIVVANAVGSNITNILLIVGMLSVIGGNVFIKRDLLKTELPVFFISTTIFIAIVFDGSVDRVEALLLLGTFLSYVWYLFVDSASEHSNDSEQQTNRPGIEAKSIYYIVLGVAAVLIGAHYTVEMVVNIATTLEVPIGLVSIAAIALGTSLPELFVSLRAIKDGEAELAIGNIFGSNAFNMLIVVSIPALITPLVVDEVVMQLGLKVLIAASAIFFVTGLAKQVMRWEGMMMLMFFLFFIAKLASFL